ncbi:DUF6551 family protein [Pacificispira sp.]|uniref:DUF6551 family protein n=1 Tax=Pacificispira sp. TaxID=2888761 RepID=UPI003BA8A58F
MDAPLNPIGPPPAVLLIDKSVLSVDPRYQRSMSEKRSAAAVARIVREFDWHKFGALVCADNADGTYVVIDGQHRLHAALEIGEIRSVPCVVPDAETLKEQAEAFVGINKGRVNINPLQIFHAERIAGDETALAIARVLDASGCSIPRNVKHSSAMRAGEILSVSAVASAVKVYGEAKARRALSILREAYPEGGGDLRGPLIAGVVRLIGLAAVEAKSGGPEIDDARLVAAIAEQAGEDWIRAGRALSEHLVSTKLPDAIRMVVVRAYNRNLPQTRRLPWDR